MNIIINETDHPLTIKVASIQSARMQVYFIDNEDFFSRKAIANEKDGSFFEDNDERAIFFCRGIVETVRKLSWAPDIIHCNGWMGSMLPYLVRVVYRDNPLFADTRIVYSLYDDDFTGKFSDNFAKKVLINGVDESIVPLFDNPNYVNLTKAALKYSDAVIMGSENLNPELVDFVKTLDVPVLDFQNDDTYIDQYNEFYNEVMVPEEVYSE